MTTLAKQTDHVANAVHAMIYLADGRTHDPGTSVQETMELLVRAFETAQNELQGTQREDRPKEVLGWPGLASRDTDEACLKEAVETAKLGLTRLGYRENVTVELTGLSDESLNGKKGKNMNSRLCKTLHTIRYIIR